MSAATADIRRRFGRLSPRLLRTLLALSVGLNLFFVAGALWIRLHPPAMLSHQEQRYQRMAAELDLDAKQRTGFDRYVAAMRVRTTKMHQEVAPLYAAAWQEMKKPQAEAAQVTKLFEAASDKRHAYRREATAETLAFLAMLSPAQRAKFVAIARERWTHRHHKHAARP